METTFQTFDSSEDFSRLMLMYTALCFQTLMFSCSRCIGIKSPYAPFSWFIFRTEVSLYEMGGKSSLPSFFTHCHHHHVILLLHLYYSSFEIYRECYALCALCLEQTWSQFERFSLNNFFRIWKKMKYINHVDTGKYWTSLNLVENIVKKSQLLLLDNFETSYFHFPSLQYKLSWWFSIHCFGE